MLRLFLTLILIATAPASRALPPETLDSVVSVLPVWPGLPQGGSGAPPGTAPEGSGVVIAPTLIVTALHALGRAEKIDIRLHDGRILPVRLIGSDPATDIALLETDTELPPIPLAPDPVLAQPVCAIGNAYGLDLSVTCGVVSTLHVTDAGFNQIEDFIQTDAAVNPGSSGGALVDTEGRLVAMLSAIFASDADANIGINFAVSTPLLTRTVAALACTGKADWPDPGWQLQPLSKAARAEVSGAFVASVDAQGKASSVGIEPGDIIARIGSRQVRNPRDAEIAVRIGEGVSPIVVVRDGVAVELAQDLPTSRQLTCEKWP